MAKRTGGQGRYHVAVHQHCLVGLASGGGVLVCGPKSDPLHYHETVLSN